MLPAPAAPPLGGKGFSSFGYKQQVRSWRRVAKLGPSSLRMNNVARLVCLRAGGDASLDILREAGFEHLGRIFRAGRGRLYFLRRRKVSCEPRDPTRRWMCSWLNSIYSDAKAESEIRVGRKSPWGVCVSYAHAERVISSAREVVNFGQRTGQSCPSCCGEADASASWTLRRAETFWAPLTWMRPRGRAPMLKLGWRPGMRKKSENKRRGDGDEMKSKKIPITLHLVDFEWSQSAQFFLEG